MPIRRRAAAKMESDDSDSEIIRAPKIVRRKGPDPNAITTNSLTALQSDDQRRVMDIVDKLRRTGLSGIVALPQLVVCGDQSSGKSSVLEAITEIPFPRKENLCTRFATEIILRRSHNSTIAITITPDKTRPPQEQASLKSFTNSITDFSELPGIMEQATSAMGLGRVGERGSRAFSRDVLSVEICGPDRPQLTLVDLPGLIHTTNKAQSKADKDLILDLVKDYMKNPRTIVLAVVSAKNDFANQIILDHCKSLDKKGERTLGIVTKPDYLREGSQNELDWIELAQNKNIYFKLGWHVLKNRSDQEMQLTFEERNQSENLFFNKGRYTELAREMVGIDSLRQRLSKLLLLHLIKELPSLRDEMASKLQETCDEIEKLGEKRSTLYEQRVMLMKIATRTNGILKDAVKGNYELDFFGAINMDATVDSVDNLRRFRAVVQQLNTRFADNMRLRGHKFAIASDPGEDDTEMDDEQRVGNESLQLDDLPIHVVLPKPKELTREHAITWVQKVLVRSRGNELPGSFNPTLISQLFWEQSQPWEKIASEHIASVAKVCKDFVYAVIQFTAPPELLDRLIGMSVNAVLKEAWAESKQELRRLLKDKSRSPMTYNHYFTTTIQKMRQRKHRAMGMKAKEKAEAQVRDFSGTTITRIDPSRLEQALNDSIEQNMDKFSAQEALDNQRAYYKDELKYFVNAVCKQAVERHLVDPLPELILSPLVVTKLSDAQVEYIAAEPPHVTQQRAFLENRQTTLEKGMETFHEAMGGLRR